MSVGYSYINPPGMISVATILPALSVISVALRFHTRRTHKAPIMADDWFIVPAMLTTVGMGIALLVGAARNGIGYPKDVPLGATPEEEFAWRSPLIETVGQVQYSVQLLSIISLGSVKLSFIFFYRRIFNTGHQSIFSILTVIMGVLIVIWTLGFFFAFVFYCGTDIWAQWSNVYDLVTYCPDGTNRQLALAVSDFLMDLIIIVMPIPQVWVLRLSLTKKLLVSALFLLGAFAVVASVVRMVIFIQVVTTGFDPNYDGNLMIALILFWSLVETGIAIIAACLPTLRGLVGRGTMERLVNSVLSAFSLNSLSSRYGGQQSARHRQWYNRHNDPDVERHLKKIEGESTMIVRAAVNESPQILEIKDGGIMVKKKIIQEESRAEDLSKII